MIKCSTFITLIAVRNKIIVRSSVHQDITFVNDDVNHYRNDVFGRVQLAFQYQMARPGTIFLSVSNLGQMYWSTHRRIQLASSLRELSFNHNIWKNSLPDCDCNFAMSGKGALDQTKEMFTWSRFAGMRSGMILRYRNNHEHYNCIVFLLKDYSIIVNEMFFKQKFSCSIFLWSSS